MKTSNIFRVIKQRVMKPEGGWPGFAQHHYICVAADLAHLNGRLTKRSARRAQKIVRERLGESSCVESWLYAHLDVVRPNRYTKAYYKYHADVQDYRHRWLDALIAEFEAKGD